MHENMQDTQSIYNCGVSQMPHKQQRPNAPDRVNRAIPKVHHPQLMRCMLLCVLFYAWQNPEHPPPPPHTHRAAGALHPLFCAACPSTTVCEPEAVLVQRAGAGGSTLRKTLQDPSTLSTGKGQHEYKDGVLPLENSTQPNTKPVEGAAATAKPGSRLLGRTRL